MSCSKTMTEQKTLVASFAFVFSQDKSCQIFRLRYDFEGYKNKSSNCPALHRAARSPHLNRMKPRRWSTPPGRYSGI